jgi:hypothetical protein
MQKVILKVGLTNVPTDFIMMDLEEDLVGPIII